MDCTFHNERCFYVGETPPQAAQKPTFCGVSAFHCLFSAMGNLERVVSIESLKTRQCSTNGIGASQGYKR